MTPPSQLTAKRTLSTAEVRREEVLAVAMKAMGERGLYGTPTMEIARAAGISQAYLFRLFPTKTELFLAVIERSFLRVHDTFLQVARDARREGESPMDAMGEAYGDLLKDPDVLLAQLQGQAAASEPAVREALRNGFRRLFEMVERESDATPLEIQDFFARGMLCNVIAAMQIDDVQERWAEVLSSADGDGCS
jgi:AcrR family transcriptional regulator